MKKIRKGKLIVIEGIDGSGKATQLKLLRERLQKAGIAVDSISFPQYEASFFGKYAGRMLRGEFGKLLEIDPHFGSILYALDRYEAKERIVGSLNDGKWVLLDRYTPSNFHQAAKQKTWPKRKEIVNYFETMEYEILKSPREDAVVFLNMDPKMARKLMLLKDMRLYTKGRKRDIAERDLKHQIEASKVYQWAAKNRHHWVMVESVTGRGLKSALMIHEEVVKELKKKGFLSKKV